MSQLLTSIAYIDGDSARLGQPEWDSGNEGVRQMVPRSSITTAPESTATGHPIEVCTIFSCNVLNEVFIAKWATAKTLTLDILGGIICAHSLQAIR